MPVGRTWLYDQRTDPAAKQRAFSAEGRWSGVNQEFPLFAYQVWRDRLSVPTYTVSEAARYAQVRSSTVYRWHLNDERKPPLLSPRERRAELSYLQLVELAFVALFRRAGLRLPAIRRARAYLGRAFHTDYPFTSVRLKTEGQHILLDLVELEPVLASRDLVASDEGGQIAWADLLSDRFEEFDYIEDLAVVWHLAGRASPVSIDPRIAFGAPAVQGVATWTLKARYLADESLDFIAEDLGLERQDVVQALRFERLKVA